MTTEWFIEGLLPKRGLVVIAGGVGTGKSKIAIELAVSVATRGKCFNTRQAQLGDVGYYSWDEGYTRAHSRLVEQYNRTKTQNKFENLTYRTQEYLKEFIAKTPVDLMVLDMSLSNTIAHSSELHKLRQFQIAHNIAVVVTAQLPRGATSAPFPDADVVLTITRVKMGTPLLTAQYKNSAPEQFILYPTQTAMLELTAPSEEEIAWVEQQPE